MIKAIIFDVGSVLMLERKALGKVKRHYKGVHEELAKKLGRSLDSWFDAIDTPYGKSFAGEISDKKAISEMAGNLRVSERKLIKLYKIAIRKHFKRNNKLYEIVFSLKKKGFIVGILSDQWALSRDELIPKKDAKIFDVAVISDDVGIRKPNIKIYKLLLRKLRAKKRGIKTSEVLFIDNRKYNLKPARELGMKTILFKDNKQLIKDMEKLGIRC